jgi:two-component system LytT family response regulator
MSTIARSPLSSYPLVPGSRGIRAVVVAEQPHVHVAVRALLDADSDIESIAEYRSLEEAIQSNHAREPVLMFVHLSAGDSAGMARLHHSLPRSGLVLLLEDTMLKSNILDLSAAFVSARFPLEEVNFLDVVRRVKQVYDLQMDSAIGNVTTSSRRTSPEPTSLFSDRLVIKTRGRFVFLSSREIDWLEAKGNYVQVYAGTQCFTQRQTMNGLESRLDPRRFRRIHRSAIVNIEKIRELRPWPTGEYVVVLRSGKELTLSRSYRQQLPGLLADTM